MMKKTILVLIQNKIKQLFKFISKNFKIIIIGIVTLLIIKRISKIGKVSEAANWEKIPGDNSAVYVYNNNGRKEYVKLPCNPKTNKIIHPDSIVAIGIPDNKKEYIDVQIVNNNNIINRRK